MISLYKSSLYSSRVPDIKTTVYNVAGTEVMITTRLDRELLARVVLSKKLRAVQAKREAVVYIDSIGRLV